MITTMFITVLVIDPNCLYLVIHNHVVTCLLPHTVYKVKHVLIYTDPGELGSPRMSSQPAFVEQKKIMAAKYPEDEVAAITDDLLNCLICTEPYKNPKVLPCQHTFCSDCLER